MQWLIIKFLKNIYLKINNQNLINLKRFWHQMNGLGEKRKRSPRLWKMVEKWIKTTKRHQWSLFTALKGKSQRKRKKMTRATAWSSIYRNRRPNCIMTVVLTATRIYTIFLINITVPIKKRKLIFIIIIISMTVFSRSSSQFD